MNRLFSAALCVAVALPAVAASPLARRGNAPGEIRQTQLQTIRKYAPRQSAALPLPVTFPLSTADEIDGYAKVDANADGKTWAYESGSALCEGIGCTELDDWLILPAVSLNAPSGNYSLSLEAKKLVKDETFDICISPTENVADAIVVCTFTNVSNLSFGPLNGDFTVAAPGDYHVMIHARSNPAGLSLNIRNLQIAENGSSSFTVPFEMAPESAEMKYITIEDTNGDGKTWFYDTSNKGLSYEAHATNNADDYALLPAIQIEEAGCYKFSWECRGWGGNLESMSVLYGIGDDVSQFEEVFAEPKIGPTLYRRQVVVSIATPGEYRFALHATSPANRYKLLARNFRLEATDEHPAIALPAQYAGPYTLNSSDAYAGAFVLPADAKVKVRIEAKGDAVGVGYGNAPDVAACANLFDTTPSEQFSVAEKTFNTAEGGIRYLRLASDGVAEVANVTVMIADDEEQVYELPFSIQPNADEFGEFKVVNVAGDASTWTYYENFGAAKYNFSNSLKADDWLILPAVNVADTEHMLNFALQARGMATTLPETFEVWVGRDSDPAAMTLIYTSPEVRTEQFTPYSFAYAPLWTGKTYFAVRATSEPKMFHLFVRDFVIEQLQRTTSVPRPAEDITAAPTEPGSLSAVVTFLLPTLSESGEVMETSTLLTATLTCGDERATVIGTPGLRVSATIRCGQGEHTVSVVVANAAGESNAAEVSVYTGQDKPAEIRNVNLSASEDNMTVNISWTLPEEGADGGYVDASAVTYRILHSTGQGGSATSVGTVTGECAFNYTLPAGRNLDMHYFAIEPTNVAGTTPAAASKGIMLGKPHSIPATENFAGGEINLGPVGMAYPDETYTLTWYFDNPALAFDEATNASAHALIAFTEEAGAARGQLHLPKFSTVSDQGARLTLSLYNYPHFARTEAYGIGSDGLPVLIGVIEPAQTPGWKEYSLPLPQQLMGRQWVEVYLDFGFSGEFDDEIWMLDGYGMQYYLDKDLDIRPLNVHGRMKVNTPYQWSFRVGNYGRDSMELPETYLNFTTLEGESVSIPAANAADAPAVLAPDETFDYTFAVTLGTEVEGDIYYDCSVVSAGDGNPENDSVFGEVTVWQQDEYVVRDLAGTRTPDGSAELQWSAPQTDAYGIFYADNMESWNYSEEIGLFRNIDRDGIPTMRFVGKSYPGMGAVKAWQVWDYADAGFDYIYCGYLGTAKSLIVFGPGDGQTAADDWLISPEVKGGTHLTFYVRPLHYAYGSEKLEILYSAGGDEPEDFSLLSTYLTQTGDRDKTPYWEEVEVSLPENARHFAIRYVSRDVFGLQLDDIIYTPAQSEENDLMYTIFRNGEAIASDLSVTSYTDNYGEAATWHVAAQKAYGGLHPLSNAVTLDVATSVAEIAHGMRVSTGEGEIAVEGCAGVKLTVTDIAGRVIYTGIPADELHLEVSAGIYIINDLKVVVK